MTEVLNTDTRDTETIVVCRLAGGTRSGLWIMGVFGPLLTLLLFGLSYRSTHQVIPSLEDALMMSGFFLAVSMMAAVYQYRTCVVADSKELRWRYGGRWRRAAWDDVVSYSDHWSLNSASQKKPSIKVKTLEATLTVWPENWTLTEELREAITQNATKVASPTWIVTGAEHGWLPLKCKYDTTVNRNILGWMEKVHKYGLLTVALYFAVQWFMTHTLPGWGWLLTPTGLFVIAKQTLPFLLRPMYRATQPRLGDKVFADRDSLRFVSGGIETVIRWEEITDLYAVGIRNVVVTPDGERDFLDTLSNSERLKLVIPRLAANAGYRGWRTGTVRRQERASPDGRQVTQNVYRYRSQNNCAGLWGITLVILFIAGMLYLALLAYQSSAIPSLIETGLAGASFTGLLVLLWLWGNYWRGEIRTDTDGITQQTVLGKRFLAWSQIREFHWRGDADLSWGRVQGMSGTLWFWKGIGDADRLADEIAAKTEF